MKTLYVIRHGQTVWNVERRMQGRLDSALTEAGVEQAHLHGNLLKSTAAIEALYVSPSGRTRETAYILNSYVRAPISYADELMERDIGEWSGLTMDEVRETFPGAFREREGDPYHHRPPGGENLADMRERVSTFLEMLLGSEHEQLAIVTHQVMSRVILGALLALPEPDIVRVVHPNDIVYRVQDAEGEREVAHFLAGEGPRAGLLQHSDGGTISSLDARDTDTRR